MTPNVENDAALRGLTFRVEAACDGYANLMDSDVPDDVIDPDAYMQGARDAAEGIRSVARPIPPVEPIRCATRCSQWPDCRHDWTWFESRVIPPADGGTDG